jgi:hypothetical protein
MSDKQIIKVYSVRTQGPVLNSNLGIFSSEDKAVECAKEYMQDCKNKFPHYYKVWKTVSTGGTCIHAWQVTGELDWIYINICELDKKENYCL